MKAEEDAARHLERQGFHILARRWTPPRGSGAGELDLIARTDTLLCFVEVKYRPEMSTGFEAISPRQQARIARAAEAYLAAFPDLTLLDIRFDAVAVTPGGSVHHLPDAFRPGF